MYQNKLKVLFISFFIILYCLRGAYGFIQEDFSKAVDTLKCQNCDLSNADFTGKKLAGIDIEQSNLSSSKLINADLSILKQEKRNVPSNLQRVNFMDADLSGANLEGAKLNGAYLKRTIFKNANLKDADLSEAIIKDADFDGANLDGTIFPVSFTAQLK